MTHTEQFIKDAIAGGWKWHASKVTVFKRGGELRFKHDSYREAVNEHEILLDPLAWQAVGKTRGWNIHKGWCECEECVYSKELAWNTYQHLFIDHLADGLSIEDAVGKL